MILPTKHIPVSRSIISLSSILMNSIQSEQETISSLWYKCRNLPEFNTFHIFTLSLSFLYMLDLITFENGLFIKVRTS